MRQSLAPEDLEHMLRHAESAWQDLRGRSLFITGGTGFFGRWLLEGLAHANDRLSLQTKATVLTRDPAAFALKAPHLASRPDIRLHAGDLRDFVFPEGEFTHIIHAGTTSAYHIAPDEMFDTILSGTRRVLDFAAQCGVRKLLFTSSGAVYGRLPPEITHVSEEYAGAPDCTLPSSAYGEGKRAAELMCVLAASRHGFEAKIARCFAFVGPHLPQDSHFAIGNFMRDVLAGEDIRILGDGQPRRSYLYAADLAVWLWTILCQGQSCRAYNVGSGEDLSILETAQAVHEAAGSTQGIQVAQKPVPGQPRPGYVPCVRRAGEELGLHVRVSLCEAIRRTLHWTRHGSAL